MRELLILSAHSFREQLRGRFFSMILLFGGLILYMSLLLGALAADQEPRVLLDFGLSFIELMATGAACYAAATGLLRELEMKTIYLVLTRPVSRSSYLLGRFFGLLAAAACAAALMSLLHLSLLFLKGWHWENAYLLALAGIGLKLMVAVSLAGFLALISTSALS
ncbi:MAG: ABC transporter permease subunit, partial [Elusimicrobiota bacterium]